MENPNYYSIIPANVRYDKKLKANEKLLYAEITSLCNMNGICVASNQYFANLYDVSKETVSRWITNLVKRGYIKAILVYKNESKEVDKRIISICTPIDENVNTSLQKNQYPIDEKINTPIDENVKDNISITYSNNINLTDSNNIYISKPFKFDFKKSLILYGFDEKLVNEWLLIRKNKKATNTETAFNNFIKEIEKTKKNINEVLEIIVDASWSGFKAHYLENKTNLGFNQNKPLEQPKTFTQKMMEGFKK